MVTVVISACYNESASLFRVLIESGFLEEGDAKATADFLFREGRLSKKQVRNGSI